MKHLPVPRWSPKVQRVQFLLLVGSLVTAAGCGESGISPVPAEGKVTLDGAPLANASLTFFATGEDGAYGFAISDPDGHFSVSHGKEKGLRPGKYKVTVIKSLADEGPPRAPGKRDATERAEWREKSSVSLLPEIYGKVTTTTLVADVPPGGVKNLELSLKK
jgi:hypothetical protein